MARRTAVGIIGAGPAGLLLSHLLRLAGVDSVVLESRSRYYVERRVRAGVIEHAAAQLLRDAGAGARMDREGLHHGGIQLRFAGRRMRIDFQQLTGRGIHVYGQQEVIKDLIAAGMEAGATLLFGAEARGIEELDGDRAEILYTYEGREERLECDYVAACDGAHGVGRKALLARGATVYEQTYPMAWLGILAARPPAAEELIYAYHQRGFALHSMRSPEISRLYLQVGPNETVEAWPGDRVWPELRVRLAEPSLDAAEILDIGVTAMTGFVVDPMQSGRLYLAGDAAHIVPPTGAKGMNLALADVAVLAAGLIDALARGSSERLERYSEDCLRRAWRAHYFSAFMTRLLHRFPMEDAFDDRLHIAELEQVTGSKAAATALAEGYTGAASDPT
jgi:p-hydroxybenzoate 3-monooxygenase